MIKPHEIFSIYHEMIFVFISSTNSIILQWASLMTLKTIAAPRIELSPNWIQYNNCVGFFLRKHFSISNPITSFQSAKEIMKKELVQNDKSNGMQFMEYTRINSQSLLFLLTIPDWYSFFDVFPDTFHLRVLAIIMISLYTLTEDLSCSDLGRPSWSGSYQRSGFSALTPDPCS